MDDGIEMKNRIKLLPQILFGLAFCILALHFIIVSLSLSTVFVTSIIDGKYGYPIVIIIIAIIYLPCVAFLLKYCYDRAYVIIVYVKINETNFILTYPWKRITIPFNSIVEKGYYESKNKKRRIIYFTNLNYEISPYLKKGVVYSNLFDDKIFEAIDEKYNNYFIGKKEPPIREILDAKEIYKWKKVIFQG